MSTDPFTVPLSYALCALTYSPVTIFTSGAALKLADTLFALSRTRCLSRESPSLKRPFSDYYAFDVISRGLFRIFVYRLRTKSNHPTDLKIREVEQFTAGYELKG